MQLKVKILFACCLPGIAALLASACSGSSSWDQVLDSAAPPNPEQADLSGGTAAATPEPGEQGRDRSSTVNVDRTRQAQPEEQGAGSADAASLTVRLTGAADCYAGKVRCYIDGRYVGDVGENGTLRIPVAAGNHVLEIWDSRGNWIVEFSAAPSSEQEIPIGCEGRAGEGEA